MFIRSARLFLRPGWPEDGEDLHRAIADPAVVTNLALAPWPYTLEDAQRFLARPEEHGLPRFLVTLPEAGGARIAGCIGLSRKDDAVQLGYWIARAHWGNGYASEAGRAVLELARTLGHERISAWHFVDNPASGAVLRKIGFRPTRRLAERFGAGRGGKGLAAEYAIDLGGASGNDEGPGNPNSDSRRQSRGEDGFDGLEAMRRKAA